MSNRLARNWKGSVRGWYSSGASENKLACGGGGGGVVVLSSPPPTVLLQFHRPNMLGGREHAWKPEFVLSWQGVTLEGVCLSELGLQVVL